MVLRFPSCSPRRPALLSPSPVQCEGIVTNLISASGYRAHTTSPSVSVRLVSTRQYVHRIPHPTFVTTAKRPSYWGVKRGELVAVICPTAQVGVLVITVHPLGRRPFTASRGEMKRHADQSWRRYAVAY